MRDEMHPIDGTGDADCSVQEHLLRVMGDLASVQVWYALTVAGDAHRERRARLLVGSQEYLEIGRTWTLVGGEP